MNPFRYIKLKVHPRRYIKLSDQPSLFNEGHQKAVTFDNAQFRHCADRCPRCNCIFTIQILMDDEPVALRCLFSKCDNFHLYKGEDHE